MRLALAALTSLVLLGCGVQDVTVTGDSDELSTDAAPLLGVAGQDTADRACNLILRTATRTPKNGGYETKCGTTGCFVVWTGTLDVSTAALAEGVKPYVLYKNIDQQVWTKVAATKTTGAPAGFTRYAYRLDKNTLEDGMSFSSLQHARVEVSPYLLTRLGGRVFDHNRRPGDFDTYALSASTGWDLADDAQVCAPPADVLPTLTFENGWQNAQHGALVAGKKAAVSFALERLPACRGTHNGYPAWDTRAFLRFSPGGQTVDGSVRGFNNPGGTPSNSGAVSMPFTFDVPAGATGLDVWFVNADGAGMSCTTYDSNGGANYHFSVEPRFVDAVKWVGNPGSCQSRACSRSDGAPLTWKLDSYILQRACLFNEPRRVGAGRHRPGPERAALRPGGVGPRRRGAAADLAAGPGEGGQRPALPLPTARLGAPLRPQVGALHLHPALLHRRPHLGEGRHPHPRARPQLRQPQLALNQAAP